MWTLKEEKVCFVLGRLTRSDTDFGLIRILQYLLPRQAPAHSLRCCDVRAHVALNHSSPTPSRSRAQRPTRSLLLL